jgi:hypothetical protein
MAAEKSGLPQGAPDMTIFKVVALGAVVGNAIARRLQAERAGAAPNGRRESAAIE